MPLRLPCVPVSLTAGSLLHSYWGSTGYHRPAFTVFVIGPRNRITWATAHADTASDFVVLDSSVVSQLRLALPFTRSTGVSAASGTQAATFSFPPDGVVSLFVTDYREFAYLPRPLVGFHPPGLVGAMQRSVLGQTGFLQFFRFLLDPEPPRPIVELDPIQAFPGQSGPLPLDRPLVDFIRSLRAQP
jgi:hypothetical protein